MDDKNTLRSLFKKYLEGLCTKGEIHRLYGYFENAHDEYELRRLITEALETDTAPESGFGEATEEVFREIKQKIANETAPRLFSLRWWWLYKSRTIAASLFLLLAAAAGWNWGVRKKEDESRRIEVLGEAGRVKSAILPDGTKVWLNTGSRITYKLPFPGRNRELLLQGEAFFEVARDSLHPFIIETHKVTTRVLGTSFNINAGSGNEDVRVSVLTGKVSVSRNEAEHVLVRGKEFYYDSRSGKDTVRDVAPAGIAAWKSGAEFHFRNQTMREVIGTLESHFEVTIDYPEYMKDCQVHADFGATEPLGKILNKLALSFDGEVVRKSGGEYVLSGDKCL